MDRLWPRGLTKVSARVDEWMKELAPSKELRTWFGHDPERWEDFRERYRQELETHGDLVAQLRREASGTTVTLLFAAKDEEHNNAVVLKDVLAKKPRGNA